MSLETLYWVLAVFGGAILVIRFILFMVGIGDAGPHAGFDGDINIDHDFSTLVGHVDTGGHLDAGGHMDASSDTSHSTVDHGHGLMSYLSLQSISGFFLMFGLVGLGTLQINFAPVISVLCGLVAGIFTAWCVTKLYISVLKLQSSGNMNVETALGKQGKVYLTIPANGSGVITLIIQGAQRNVDAVSEDGTVIPTDSLVVVTKVTADHLILVRSIENKKAEA
jgi:hypothetical protein